MMPGWSVGFSLRDARFMGTPLERARRGKGAPLFSGYNARRYTPKKGSTSLSLRLGPAPPDPLAGRGVGDLLRHAGGNHDDVARSHVGLHAPTVALPSPSRIR